MKNLKISFTTMATPELDLDREIAEAKRYGFDGIDFRMKFNNKGEIDEGISQEDAQAILQKLDGLALPSLLCYNMKVRDGHQQMADSILKCLDVAKKLEVSAIRIFTGKLETDEDTNVLVQVLQEVVAKDNSDIKIAMQNHINIGVTLHQALEVCQRVNSPRVGVIVSPDHAVRIGENIAEILPGLMPYVIQLYMVDVNENNDYVLIGDGCIPFSDILDVLLENGFGGYVTLKWEKCWCPNLPAYPEAFHSFLEWLYTYCVTVQNPMSLLKKEGEF